MPSVNSTPFVYVPFIEFLIFATFSFYCQGMPLLSETAKQFQNRIDIAF